MDFTSTAKNDGILIGDTLPADGLSADGPAEIEIEIEADTPASTAGEPSKHILFVNVLAETDPLYSHLARRWNISRADSSEEALDLLSRKTCDCLVAKMSPFENDEPNILTETARRFPAVVRFVICSPEERARLKPCAGTIPYPIPNDADAETCLRELDRGFQIQTWLADQAVKVLVERIHTLPSLPALYMQVVAELQSPDASIDFVAKLIARDPVMTAKMLQLVNSAYFSLPREITDPGEAVLFLGAERTKTLVLLAKVFSQFDRDKCAGFSPDRLWQHSMAVGSLAMTIAKAEIRDPKLAEMAFTAGLLHDVGKLLLAANLPESYSLALDQAERRKVSHSEIECEAFGAGHAELAGALFGMWGLPLPIVQSVAYHHSPGRSGDKSFSLLTAVHAANAIEKEKMAALTGIHASQMDAAYIESLNLTDRCNLWRERCGCSPKPPGAK